MALNKKVVPVMVLPGPGCNSLLTFYLFFLQAIWSYGLSFRLSILTYSLYVILRYFIDTNSATAWDLPLAWCMLYVSRWSSEADKF